ncbi:MAG: helix-turn-helix transcriptional regulator [Rhodocyclaceae bacterium]|nr:helix-turn-helix transcriptional regulator [Rhodocyclaceae bacterium]
MTPFTLALRRLFERHPHANQTELARFVGVTPQAVQQWVAGATQPSPERIEKVAQFFGVRAADLLQRLANEEASAAERALKEALQAEGWTVEALRRLDATLPELFQEEGFCPDLKATQDGHTLYIEIKSRPLGQRGVAQYRRLLSLAQRAGNLIVAEPGEWRLAVAQAQRWLEARQAMRDERYVRLALLEVEAAAGSGHVNAEHPDFVGEITLAREEAWALLGRRDLAALKLISVRGDSMMPTLHPRDLLFVDTRITTFKEDGLYVLLLEDALLVKRLQRLPGGRIAVKSDNPAYETFTLEPAHAARIIGQVIAALPLRFTLFA